MWRSEQIDQGQNQKPISHSNHTALSVIRQQACNCTLVILGNQDSTDEVEALKVAVGSLTNHGGTGILDHLDLYLRRQ